MHEVNNQRIFSDPLVQGMVADKVIDDVFFMLVIMFMHINSYVHILVRKIMNYL